MNLRHMLRKSLWGLGFDVVRFQNAFHPVWQRRQLIERTKVSCVLDVGANVGGFARYLRNDVGYRGRLVSFEPLSEAFAQLQREAAGDPAWQLVNCALGNRDEAAEINIAGNSQSSSLLDMLPAHEKAAPDAGYRGKETISVRRLDSIFGDYCRPADSVYLKIDTQGFEAQVLEGARESLRQVSMLQLELSVVPLYEGETLATDMIAMLQSMGFALCHLEPVFKDKQTQALLQVDGLFFRG